MMTTLDNIQTTALNFLQQNAGEHFLRDRALLIDRCIAHLVDTHNVSRITANEVTMQALGELDYRNRRTYIDCSRTTSYTLFLVDQDSGVKRAFTTAELMQLIGPLKPAHPSPL